jgi:polyribonucleotide nucleotidyltransferase
MFNTVKKTMEWGEETLTLETGKIARQADGCVIATYGETSVMAERNLRARPKAGAGFLPADRALQRKVLCCRQDPRRFLQARSTSDGKRDADLAPDRPSDPPAVCPDGFKNEVLVICTVLSHDLVNDPDMVAMIAASAALTISGVPFMGPIAACRVGFEDGEYILNPTVDDMQDLRN